MSQGTAAIALGVHLKTVQSWEYGKSTPTQPRIILKMSEVYLIDLHILMRELAEIS